MSTWNAINVELEEDASPDLDDTKEIQLEEAFKLYQNALRIHALGPSNYHEAESAYDELFRSEVFRYPEAVPEFEQDQADEVSPALTTPIDITVVPVTVAGASDNANSLTQLVYLAYKNRAQFEIDFAHATYERLAVSDRQGVNKHYNRACRQSLINSAIALEQDDTDLDLWKRASRVSGVLQTLRLVRFCLESVLAADDEGEDAIDLSGLEEAFANGELQSTLDTLGDNLSRLRTSNLRPKSSLLALLKQSNDPYPFLPTKSTALEYIDDKNRPLSLVYTETRLVVESATHLAVGQTLLRELSAQDSGDSQRSLGAIVKFEMPQAVEQRDVDMTANPPDLLTTEEKEVRGDSVHVVSNGELDSPASFHSVQERTEAAGQSLEDEMVQPNGEVDADIRGESETAKTAEADTDLSVLVSRKRSSTTAGNEEPEARTKSKRIKARESMIGTTAQEEEVSLDPSSISRDQALNIEAADDSLFALVNGVLDKVGVGDLGSIGSLRQQVLNNADEYYSTHLTDSDVLDGVLPATSDLRCALKGWGDDKNAAFITGHGGRDHVEKSTGLSLFLKHSKANPANEVAMLMVERSFDVDIYTENVNANDVSMQEALFLWLLLLLTQSASANVDSPYLQGLWSTQLKAAVVKILTIANETIMSSFRMWTRDAYGWRTENSSTRSPLLFAWQAAEFAQTLFELHIEIYSEMTNPASSVDDAHRKAQEARMRLWAQASADTVQPAFQTCAADQNHERIIALRYLWASVMFTKLTNPTKKSHVLTCLNDLQGLLEHAEVAEIYLPNNTAIPVISASAVEQEISKVQTLEFFMSVFDSDNSEPESVIMKLEPVLEYDEATRNSHPSDSKVEQILNFRSFLSAGDASLTLFLWKRLQNAYTAISYNTKVVSCLLRSIETVVQEIANNFNRHESASECQMSLLRWLRDADDLTVKVLGKVADDKAAFECIDESHLKTSMSAILILIRIVYGFVLFDDQLRVGDISPPSFRNATASKNFEKSRDRFREMHVRLWTLLYLMVKEFTVQMPAAFDDAELDLILMVRCVHAALGERHYCKHCNKLFVRVAKTELFSFASAEDLSLDIAQVIFDLYQIRLSAGYGDVDHGCMAEPLEKDKRTAQTLVPMIMDYVKRLNVKDVMRSDLKTTIERIQHALGQPKPSTAVSFNRRAVSGYLKSVINPQRVYQALRGIGELELKVVHTESSAIAMQGWYLLLGNLTLTKYRSVKRVNPTPTDDLDNALAYLRQDIEHNAASWESWYRLAQVHDAKIEDSLIWNSNKLNDGRAELATMERNSINAYTMATAIAMRTAGDDASTKKLLDDMSFEFACRLYSSSRPPLDMEAFSTKKAVRHLSDHRSQAMSEEPLFKPMSKYNIWSLAAHLIRKSISGDCSHWTRYYILGKCLWKMFNSTTNIETRHPTTIDDVLDTLIEAVNRVPKKERSSEPILEPHFKLVSCVHKLQDRNVINVSQAVGYLQATSYARNIQVKEDDHGRPHWETYILSALKKLQNADKSGWHHRITARAAHVIYDHDRSIAAALGAKHQFADSIFTKNMTMQVWKPENERAGRHYVYTGRYLHFFVEILDKLKDRSNLEQVVRKIRRKTTDFINHTQVWENAVTAYVDLLRRIGSIPHGKERALFDNITFDEFTRQSEKLEQWAHEPETTTTYLDIIKDAIEMKKLNNSLMKGPAIDDLIGDAYACMYELYVSQLPPEEQAPPQPMVSLPQGTFINMTHQTAPSGDDSRDRMRLNNLLSGQTDGVSGLTPEATPKVTGLGIIDPGSDTVSAPPTDVVRVPAPAKPGRAKTITKREVQKKAEGAIGKPPPIKTPTLTKRSISINIPSIKRTASEDRNDDDDGSVRGHANVASGVSSRRGSVSRRNSPNLVADGMDDEGGDGDNEEDEDDGNESEASDADEDETKASKKRLFPGLAAGDDEADEVEEDEEGEDEEIDENTEDERMSDAKAEQDDEIEGLEIPDSQELTGKARKDADGMDTD